MAMPGRFKCYSCGGEHRIATEMVIDLEDRNFILARGIKCERKDDVINGYRKRLLQDTYIQATR